ncbi:hypothetical protein OUZ56_022549 [Daphnia magna]|uniref:Uncharacterized protein n=1 Tax=Daphnia magna TaxID=35525 RepID=A0ABR0AWQ4_9CRUS|nr:hypothetical protein OUZ56_022549 [Daphnia magna]
MDDTCKMSMAAQLFSVCNNHQTNETIISNRKIDSGTGRALYYPPLQSQLIVIVARNADGSAGSRSGQTDQRK